MTGFITVQEMEIEDILRQFPFLEEELFLQELDAISVGTVLAFIAGNLNTDTVFRRKYLSSILDFLERNSSRTIVCDNYIVTEFLENLDFTIDNFSDYGELNKLYKKYLIGKD